MRPNGLAGSRHAVPGYGAPVPFRRASEKPADMTPASPRPGFTPLADMSVQTSAAFANQARDHDKKQVPAEHLSSVAGNTVAATRGILQLLRDDVRGQGPDAAVKLDEVEPLWVELEEIYASLKLAAEPHPQEAPKKENVAPAPSGEAVSDLTSLVEKVSRLTLDRGLLKGELADAQRQASRLPGLEKQLRTLTDLNKNLVHQASASSTKVKAMEDRVGELQGQLKVHKDKYDIQTQEFGNVWETQESLKKQAKDQADAHKTELLARDAKINALKGENQDMEIENNELLGETKKLRDELKKKDSDMDMENKLLGETKKLRDEIKEKDLHIADMTIENEMAKLKISDGQADATAGEIETKVKEAEAAAREAEKKTVTEKFESEIAKLQQKIAELEVKAAAREAENKLGTGTVQSELQKLEQKCRELEDNKVKWVEAGDTAYKLFDKKRHELQALREAMTTERAASKATVDRLQKQLDAAQAQSPHSTDAKNAQHWKDRYDNLVKHISGLSKP